MTQRSFKLVLCSLLALLAAVPVLPVSGLAQSPESGRSVPGRWGALVDPEAPPAFASERDGQEHLRRQQMRAISAHYRSVETMLALKDTPAALIAAEAQKLADFANILPALFPDGSQMRPASFGASEKIWTEFPRFIQHVAAFGEATQALSRTAREATARGQLPAALAAVRHECLACHREFRVRAAKQ